MEILVAHNFVGTISVLAYGFLQAFNFDPFPALQGNEFPSSFFGFQNMTAEFIGLSILIQIYSLFKMESGFKSRSLLLTLPVLVASLIYLKTLECRSVFLSLLVSTVPLLFSRRSVKIRLSAIGFLTLVSLMILPHIYKPLNIWPNIVNSPTLGDQKNSDQLHQIKSSNSSLRLVRWLNTLHMIQNNPWGVGPGNFEFSYLPFSKAYQRDLEISENTLVKAPHNGYLQAAAQSGIPFSILLTISFILFGYKLYRKLNLESPFKKELTLSASISIFLLIDGFFAFPMDNAYPFYLIAVTIGFTLRMLCNRTYLVQKSLSNIGLTILAIAIGSTTLAFNFSKYVEGLYEEDTTLDLSNAMKISCLLFPSNWHNCISFGDLAIKSGQYKEAELVALKLLNANHSHFPAMRILAFSLFNQGDFIGGCRELKRYDSLFANQSSLHLPYVNFCSDHRSSLSRSSSLDDSTLDP
jgi:O-antigen ligase